MYRADVSTNNPVDDRFYIGATATSFKARLANHKKAFVHHRYRGDTTLAAYIWELRERGVEASVKWSVIAAVSAHKPGDTVCGLCLAEKAIILEHYTDKKCLNSRTELFTTCRHRRSSLLSSVSG